MKRWLFAASVLGLSALVSLPVAAQIPGSNLVGAVIGGPNRSDFEAELSTGGFRWGWQAGALVEKRFGDTKIAAVRLEGWYVQKGEDDYSGPINTSVRINYVEFPLMLVIGTPMHAFSRSRFYGMVGGEFAFKVSCNVSAASGVVGGSSSCSDVDLNVKSTDYGVIAGIGFAFDRFAVDFRYDWGLANILEDEVDEAKNRSYAFTFAIVFPLGR
jgi:opacity protein-like surface antigen